MNSPPLQSALAYRKRGFSIIPVGQDKRPLIKWAPFQQKQASEAFLAEWWTKYPQANIGIVTGKISGITVVDLDSQHAIDYFLEQFKTGCTPCADTPHGMHFYFKYEPGTRNTVKLAGMDIDLRSDGGYILAPPSVNAEGTPYRWTVDLSTPMAPMPLFLKEGISYKSFISLYRENQADQPDLTIPYEPDLTIPYEPLRFLTEGSRDNDLFHIANCLAKGGCENDKTLQVLEILATNCNPPFPEKEVKAKLKSVLTRCARRERNLAEDIRSWIDLTKAYFSLTEMYEPLRILTTQKNTVHQIMFRFAEKEYIERHPSRNGVYRRIDKTIEYMDFENADLSNVLNLKLPLNIHEKTKFFPKAVVTLAGVSGMGKTLFALDTIRKNMNSSPCFYFNSEMGPEALKQKLSYFPTPMSEWGRKMKVIDGWNFNNIADKIQPDALNVVDYLEPEGDKAFNIHGVISAIIRKLEKGSALVTIQKKPDSKMGTGGIYSIKAASLALSLDFGRIEIVKNRFREADLNPSQNVVDFEVLEGYEFKQKGSWHAAS